MPYTTPSSTHKKFLICHLFYRDIKDQMDGDGGRLDDPLRGVPDAAQRQGGHLQGEQEEAAGGVDLSRETCLRVSLENCLKVKRLPQLFGNFNICNFDTILQIMLRTSISLSIFIPQCQLTNWVNKALNVKLSMLNVKCSIHQTNSLTF